jgi:hypothetical protein
MWLVGASLFPDQGFQSDLKKNLKESYVKNSVLI